MTHMRFHAIDDNLEAYALPMLPVPDHIFTSRAILTGCFMVVGVQHFQCDPKDLDIKDNPPGYLVPIYVTHRPTGRSIILQ